LGRKSTPLCQGGGAIEFEVFAAVKVTFLIEVIVEQVLQNLGHRTKHLLTPTRPYRQPGK